MVDRTKFLLVHAAPADPLFRYMPERSEHWLGEVRRINTDVLFVGHTHMPFVRTVDNCTIVNPGSIGQSKTGRTTACYATWEDGHIELKEYEYPIEETVLAIQRMPVPERDRQSLISILLTGRFPAPQSDPEILLSH
jgi:protein phosphatase